MAQVTCLDPICPQEISDVTGWFGPVSKEEAYSAMLKFKTLRCDFEVVTTGFDPYTGTYVPKTFSGSFPIIQGQAVAAADWNMTSFNVFATDRWSTDAEIGQVCNGSRMSGKIECLNSGEGAVGGAMPTSFTNNISGVYNYNASSLFSMFSASNNVSYQEYIGCSCDFQIAMYGGNYYINPRLSCNRAYSSYNDFIFRSTPFVDGVQGGEITISGLTSEPLTNFGFLYANGPVSVTASASIYAINSWQYLP